MQNMTDNDYSRLIFKYLAHEINAEEKEALLSWLEQSQENRELFASVSAMMSASRRKMDKAEYESFMARLDARIDADEAEEGKGVRANAEDRRKKTLTWTKRISLFSAAAAIAAFACISIVNDRNVKVAERTFTACTNTGKDISAIMLEDSSKVWLGRNSRIEYNVSEKGQERTVNLDGEAYFDVHHDTARAFVVNTGNLAIRVLGTAFCVNADKETGKVSVILERGSVRLQTPEGVSLVRLSPDQKAEYDNASGDISVESINATPYVIQHYNKITLSGATIGDIAAHINSMYGVNMSVPADSDTTRRYNLNYKRTDSLQSVLEIVSELTGTSLRDAQKSLQ